MRNKQFLILGIVVLAIAGVVAIGVGSNQPANPDNSNGDPNQPPVDDQNTVSFDRLDTGQNSQIDSPAREVVRSQTELETLWAQAFGQNAELPAVNLDEEMLLAVFAGQQNTGGYSIAVDKIIEKEGALNVVVTQTSPGENCMVTQALTSPYEVVKLEHTEKDVEFNVQQEVRDCE